MQQQTKAFKDKKMQRHKTVDQYISKKRDHKKELTKLRKIIKSTELVETIKWGAPVYTIDGKNIVVSRALKEKLVSSILEHTTKHGAIKEKIQIQEVKYYYAVKSKNSKRIY